MLNNGRVISFCHCLLFLICDKFQTSKNWVGLSSSSSGACRRCSHCHELSPCRSVLCTSFGWRQGSLVVGRSPPFWARSVWVGRSSVSTPQEGPWCKLGGHGNDPAKGRRGWGDHHKNMVTIERQTTSTDSIWQEWLPSAKTDFIIGNQFGPVDIQDASKVPKCPECQSF